ncbi:hypothetical protein AMTRI_Chr07g28610 [Amborella trichopoda]
MNGTRCKDPLFVVEVVLAGCRIGLALLFAGGMWIYLAMKKIKQMKLRKHYFDEQGLTAPRIFTTQELEKATDDGFEESKILGSGGFGIVYKRTLDDHTIVAIKKAKVVDHTQIHFIHESLGSLIQAYSPTSSRANPLDPFSVCSLCPGNIGFPQPIGLDRQAQSGICKHRLLKCGELLGCCLKTPVPILVYEYIPNGTLHQHIHENDPKNQITWPDRLRIALETAEALAYLHTAACMPIFHRDVKSSNIVLDHNYTAKVSDFGVSRLVPMDQNQMSTLVQGTFGYLDPEYFRTGHLTTKSVVYSFGIVLLEFLTGEKPVSSKRSQDDANLALYFISHLKGDHLEEILEENVRKEDSIEQLQDVAKLAMNCLRLSGERRSTMKNVVQELLRISGSSQNACMDENEEVIEASLSRNTSFPSFHMDPGSQNLAFVYRIYYKVMNTLCSNARQMNTKG